LGWGGKGEKEFEEIENKEKGVKLVFLVKKAPGTPNKKTEPTVEFSFNLFQHKTGTTIQIGKPPPLRDVVGEKGPPNKWQRG